jgi:hypothetical protein
MRMGMFDYLRCDVPLPETPVPPPGDEPFQTKATPDQYMTVYTITADGRLTWRPYHWEDVPKEERPYPDDDGFLGLCGSMRRVERDPEDIPYHGDIDFYAGNHPDVGWWEYKARFTEGKLARIELVEFRAPEGRDVNAEIDARHQHARKHEEGA